MSKKDGGPAFPNKDAGVTISSGGVSHTEGAGMSLRDYFAAATLQSITITYKFDWTPKRLAEGHPDFEAHEVSAYAYKIADAMLAEREK